MTGRPLAVRLALLLAAVVVVVLLVAGVVVNRAASRSFGESISARDQERLELAVPFVEDLLDEDVSRPQLEGLLRRLTGPGQALVRVLDADGDLLAEAGRLPPGADRESSRTRLSGGGALEVVVPSREAPFLRAFNSALALTGIVTVAALLVAAAFLANRLTRPLREVAAAAHRLGSGDLSARAAIGPDAESAELATAFNSMAERLQRSEALRRRAASDLAHDLATPATVLESQLQAMVDGVVPADATQLDKARAAAAGLSGVIVQLGELTHAEAAPLGRSPQALDLAELAREIVDALGGLLRERLLRVDVSGAALALADRGHLGRALRNVVTNALQHSPEGGTVRVELSSEGGAAIARVTDQGSGIAREDLPYVFERFYRADRSRSRIPGSGIGLTVARELIVANGGSLEVESTGPGGTTMRLSLPGGPTIGR
ncbi:MAG: HAMP domain-containing histidine kinase [Chloroflexi bacterium]|nr:HAMP domain-containing histidine kinase [Chloroflexota bacterium]